MGQKEIFAALRAGEFKSIAWAANVALALLFLEDDHPAGMPEGKG